MRGVQALAADVVAGTENIQYTVWGLVLVVFLIYPVRSITIASKNRKDVAVNSFGVICPTYAMFLELEYNIAILAAWKIGYAHDNKITFTYTSFNGHLDNGNVGS